MQTQSARATHLSTDDHRLLERFYNDLALAFELDLGRVDPSLDSIDEHIDPGKLRQFIQQESITHQTIRLLALRFIGKQERTPHDWDKLFLLLTQYIFCQDSRILYGHTPIGYFEICRLLAPILGKMQVEVPESVTLQLEPLQACKRLADFQRLEILDRSRKIKRLATERNDHEGLVIVTHFNLSVRKVFLRLMHAELAEIYDLLGTLENRGGSSFDASALGLSSTEPLSRVREICLKWTSPARISFGTGDDYTEIIALRGVLQQEVATVPLDPLHRAHETAHHDDSNPIQRWLRGAITKLQNGKFHADVDKCDVCFTRDEVQMLMSKQIESDGPMRRAIALRLLLSFIVQGRTPPGSSFTLQQSYDVALQEATALAAYLEQREKAGTAFRYTELTDELFSLMVEAREKVGFYSEAVGD